MMSEIRTPDGKTPLEVAIDELNKMDRFQSEQVARLAIKGLIDHIDWAIPALKNMIEKKRSHPSEQFNLNGQPDDIPTGIDRTDRVD